MSSLTSKLYKYLAQLSLAATIPFFISFNSANADDNVVRLAVVNTPASSGLLDHLLEAFEAESGYTVEVYSGSDVYDVAENGSADIVISHFGKSGLEAFVQNQMGRWPTIVFSNQSVIIGPQDDPANIKGLTSATEAFRRIAETESSFVTNRGAGSVYLTNILREGANWPADAGWVHDEGGDKARAVRLAEEEQGYTIWGALPFLRFQRASDTEMEILVSEDPLLQRIMAAVVVNPEKVEGVNVRGAEALQEYLVKPETQAKVGAFRTADSDLQLWWPSGRDN